MSLAKAIRPERHGDGRQWFDVVRDLIEQTDREILPQAEQTLRQEMVNAVKSDFGPALPITWTTETEEKLGREFKKAVDLFHMLLRQDERYFIDMVPVGQWKFSPAYMAEVLRVGEDDGALKGRELKVSVFPALYKKSRASGADAFLTTIVAKAKVITKKVEEEGE